MKIGGGPKLPSLPATLDEAARAAAKSVRDLPSVAKTPTPGGSVPSPYPNAGDSFERVERSKVGSLLQRQAGIEQMEERIEKERDAAWTSFGTSIAAAGAAFGMAGAAAAAGASSAALGAAAEALLATEAAKDAGPGAAGAAGAGAAGAAAAGAGAATGGATAAGGAAAGAAAAGADLAGAAGAGVTAAGGAATGAAGDVASALVAGAAAAAAEDVSAVSGAAAAAAQGALLAFTEAAAKGGAQGVEQLVSGRSDFVREGGDVDPDALVQWVLRESYLQTTEDLRFYAEKVKSFNDQKAAIRDRLQSLRDYDATAKGSAKGSGRAEEARQSPTQETMRLFQEIVAQASNLHRKFNEQAQAIIDNLKA